MAVEPKSVHKLPNEATHYLVGWLFADVRRGPITAKLWNEAVTAAEDYAERYAIADAERREKAKRNAMAQRRREAGDVAPAPLAGQTTIEDVT